MVLIQVSFSGLLYQRFNIPLVAWSKEYHEADHLEPKASDPHMCRTEKPPTESDVTLHSQAERHK